ncbi:Protein of unknown function DUF3328 [Penicillium occitanis (nom. inval.)]|nr:Protein of unknown function DUF3328 [Penicillium occitanis (nom. inval.)]PCG91016.1 hypothetical protein PENOC_099360 [Penicillium occitanis (nom. inval.)]
MALQTQQYSKVSSEDSVTGEEDVAYFTENWNYQRLRLSIRNRNVLLFLLSLFFFILSLLNLFVFSRGWVTDKRCAEHMAAASPVMEAVEYEWKTFENDFFHDSIYRGHPTVELEKAWDDLWNYGAFNVPKDMLPKLNKSTTGWREVPEEKGGGVAGLLEGFHQIHCLNLIRQYTYRDEWDYSALPSFDGSPQLVRHHVDHCIETLRINLMCTADVTPYLIEINPARRLGEDPNFNTLHKCRKWDKLVEWAKEHEVFRTVDPASGHQGHH